MGATGAENLLLALMMGLGFLFLGGLCWVLWKLLCGFWIWLAEFGAALVGILGFAVAVVAALIALGVL